jgi:hypothetical protein
MALTALPLTISAGQSMSAPLEVGVNLGAVRIGMPSAWTGAAITFQISLDGVTYLDLHHAAQTHEGLWVSYETGIASVIPGSILLLPPGAGDHIGWLKLRSGTRSRPVAQEADRVFQIVFG